MACMSTGCLKMPPIVNSFWSAWAGMGKRRREWSVVVDTNLEQVAELITESGWII